MTNITAELTAGLKLLGQGDWTGAAARFNAVLRAEPKHPDALHYMGLIAHQSGDNAKAAALIEAAVASNPNNAEAQSNLGTIYMAAGETQKAEAALQRAVNLNGRVAAFQFNLGNACFALKKLTEAESAYKNAVALQPQYPEAYSNLGTVYRELENLGAATACFEKAYRQKPGFAEAAYNLANAYRDAGRVGDALRMIREAVTLNPRNAKARNTLGNLLCESARSVEALAEFQAASALDPQSLAMASNVLSCMQYIPGVDDAALGRAHTAWVKQFPHLFAQARMPAVAKHSGPLRIGFVSPDLGRHPCGFLSVRLFENLSRDEVQAVIFSTRRQAREDDISRRIAAVTQWRRVDALSDDELAAQIEAAHIDVLIDMSGHTSGHRLGVFARKAAPVQMSWLGYVGTTGLPSMDYIIADRWHAPSGHPASGPEKVLRLDDGYVCYDPPADSDDVAPLPAMKNGAVTFGSLNNAAKLNEHIYDSYSRILHQVKDSRLILAFRGLGDPAVTESLRSAFKSRGVDEGRIDIRGYAKHRAFLANYHDIDIALDTFPYAGGLTTCEALWMGVPTVAFAGATFAGRHAVSHMSNAGLSDFVAANQAGFEALAVEKARDLEALAALRAGLRSRLMNSPLCDGARFAASFTRAMRSVIK